jgi:NADP-dependent 3-hydroxy acid dehydrogenase YdfG
MLNWLLRCHHSAIVLLLLRFPFPSSHLRENRTRHTMSFPYKHVLVVGATAGIGRAVAARLVQGGAKVTVVGRRADRLDDFVREHGEQSARGVAFDIGDLERIPAFAAE